MSQDSHHPDQESTRPVSSTYWDCLARYETFHKHQDGRPLCAFCHCWNPAPFPDGTHPKASCEVAVQVLVNPNLVLKLCFPAAQVLILKIIGFKYQHTIAHY